MGGKSDGSILKEIVPPLVVPAGLAIGSWAWAKFQGVEWKTVLQNIPSWAYGLAAVATLLVLVFWRRHTVKKSNRRRRGIIVGSWSGYTRIGILTRNGVKWPMVCSNDPRSFRRLNPDDVSIQAKPLCPNTLPNGKDCETELAESKNFCGKYVWRCERCQFQTKSGVSKWERAEQLTPVAKADARDHWNEFGH